MQRIHTTTGSIYEIDDDCITRLSETPVIGAPTLVLDREPLLEIAGTILVGRGLNFKTATGWTRTSPVIKIESTP